MAGQCGAVCRVSGNITGGLRASLGWYKVLLTKCPCRRGWVQTSSTGIRVSPVVTYPVSAAQRPEKIGGF